jgi:hypothetical protein
MPNPWAAAAPGTATCASTIQTKTCAQQLPPLPPQTLGQPERTPRQATRWLGSWVREIRWGWRAGCNRSNWQA